MGPWGHNADLSLQTGFGELHKCTERGVSCPGRAHVAYPEISWCQKCVRAHWACGCPADKLVPVTLLLALARGVCWESLHSAKCLMIV